MLALGTDPGLRPDSSYIADSETNIRPLQCLKAGVRTAYDRDGYLIGLVASNRDRYDNLYNVVRVNRRELAEIDRKRKVADQGRASRLP